MLSQDFEYILHLADNSLILGQRNAEWCGHGPVLEQDIAITNISLDLIGQSRMLFELAAATYNGFDGDAKASVDKLLPHPWKAFNRELQEDDLAFLRDERQFRNLLLCELPKGDWAVTVLRQFFFAAWQYLLFDELRQSRDEAIAAIAEKSLKETAYHLRWSGEWVIRLGDGTAESRSRIEKALADLWPFTGELFTTAPYEKGGNALDPAPLRDRWNERVANVFAEAGLDLPKAGWAQTGGKLGAHTEHLGYLLAEMQYLQRTYPDVTW